MPLKKERRSPAPESIVNLWLHRLLTAIFFAAFVLGLARLFTAFKLPGPAGWPEALLLVSAFACTITSATRRLPLQNVILAVFIIAVLGGAVHALGALTGIPFGPFEFGESAGAQMFKTLPWAIPLIWVVAVLNSRGVARLILRPWRKVSGYGFWLIGMTAALTLLFDFALEPFASLIKHYWIWNQTKVPLTWQGVPISNFLAWAAMSVLIAVVIAPAMINKQPGKRNAPDFHPFVLWTGFILLFGIGCALHGMIDAVVADGIVAAIITIFAVRGGTW